MTNTPPRDITGRAPETAAPPVAGRGGGLSEWLLGAIGVGMILLALVVLVRGGASDGDVPAASQPATLTLLAPADGATVPNPLELELRVPARLRAGPMGWEADGFHLHAAIDDRELMAAPGQVQPLGGDRYRWTIPGVPAGRRRVRLFWSGADHAEVVGTSSAVAEIEVR